MEEKNLLPIRVSDFNINKHNHDFVVMAGPCVIENEELVYKVAAEMKEICKKLQIPYVFKASYDKANRTSVESFRGPGIKEGLRILEQVKKDLDLWVVSDVHSVEEIEKAAEVLDIIQIPAFLCRQTDLVLAAADTGKIVNIKKGQFLSPYDVLHIAEKVKSRGNSNILITERGTSFGYNNLVVDFRSIDIIQKELGLAVIFDATHAVQLPGGMKGSSGGKREYVSSLACASMAVGAFGLFLEVHPEPEKALSDAASMLRLADVEKLLQKCKAIKKASI